MKLNAVSSTILTRQIESFYMTITVTIQTPHVVLRVYIVFSFLDNALLVIIIINNFGLLDCIILYLSNFIFFVATQRCDVPSWLL